MIVRGSERRSRISVLIARDDDDDDDDILNVSVYVKELNPPFISLCYMLVNYGYIT